VLSLSALHKYKKSYPVCSGKKVTYITSEKHSGNKHTKKLSFWTETRSRALHTKPKTGARASHCLHTATTTQFRHCVILFRYIAIMLPARAQRRDTSAATPRWRPYLIYILLKMCFFFKSKAPLSKVFVMEQFRYHILIQKLAEWLHSAKKLSCFWTFTKIVTSGVITFFELNEKHTNIMDHSQ
jgi:hypothetical protein